MVRKAGEAFIKTWPIAGIGLAVAVNGIWIAALGYGISKLLRSENTRAPNTYALRSLAPSALIYDSFVSAELSHPTKKQGAAG